jgi:hypothetical protein
MISRLSVFPLAILALAASANGPSVSYFTRTRELSVASPPQTNYFVVDVEIMQHARPDLADLRIYDGETQVPYAVALQSAGVQSAENEAKILNLGLVGDHTEFDLDLSSAVQYNHIRLTLDAKDFLVTARVQGKDALVGARPVDLGVSTLYDFSRESLGSNTTLRLPTASFRYLHVQLTKGIRPQQVKEASVYSLEEKKSYWTDVGSCGAPQQVHAGESAQGKSSSEKPTQEKPTTVMDCTVPLGVRVDRIAFSVAQGQVNFRRSIAVTESSAAEGGALEVAQGDISRVQMKRGGTVVNSEQLSVPVERSHGEHFTVTVANGDDPPLAIERVQPQAVERRVFFVPPSSPPGGTRLRLYYGDEKLGAPTYDYAKFFKEDATFVQAQLGAAEANTAFTGRPDDRPWSERHQIVLWLAMLAAVAGLGFLALRGLKQG